MYELDNMDRFWVEGGSIVVKLQVEDGADTNYRRAFVYRISDDFSIDLLRRQSSNELLSYIQVGAGNTQIASQYSSATEGEPVYVTMTWDLTNWTIYENTTLKATNSAQTATSINLDATSRTIRLGNSSIQTFQGTYFNTAIYIGKVLTLEEITDIVEEDTFSEIDAEQSQVWLPMRTQYDSSGTQVTDNLGLNSATATVGDGSTGTTFPTHISPKGMSFDGGDYLDTGYVVDSSSTDFTAGIWVKGSPLNYCMSQSHADPGAYASDWIIGLDSTDAMFWMRSDAVGTASDYEDGRWHLMVMVWDLSAETYEAFVDGVSIGTSGVVVGYGYAGAAAAKVGSSGDAATGFYTGNAFEPFIFNYKLNATQIKEIYNRGKRSLNK